MNKTTNSNKENDSLSENYYGDKESNNSNDSYDSDYSDYSDDSEDTNNSHSSLSSDDYSDSISEEDDFLYGRVLLNNYFMITKLGSGSFSSVWLSYSLKDNNLFAIKVANHEDQEEAIKEYNFITNLKIESNSNIVKFIAKYVISYMLEDVKIYRICIVMPLMICSCYELSKKGLSHNIVKQISDKTSKAIKIVHKIGYIHTDIKVENILINKINNLTAVEGVHLLYSTFLNEIKKLNLQAKIKNNTKIDILENINHVLIDLYHQINNEIDNKELITISFNDIKIIEPVLIDFGTIKENNGVNTSIVQTRYYRAPEIILRHKWNEKIDIWAFGCVLYELLTGDILLNPTKDDTHDRNIYHMLECEIISDSLKESKKYFKSCESYDKYYDENGTNKFIYLQTNKKNLVTLLKEKLSPQYSKDEIEYWINTIRDCVSFHPDKRKLPL